MACTREQRIAPEWKSDLEVAQYWLQAGGDPDKVVVATAVAMAESGGDAHALSSDCAMGLWQIWDMHAINAGIAAELFYTPLTNAKWAVELSSNGTNWAAWDVAYAAGEALTDRYFIAYPERGSAAYGAIATVAADLGISGGGSPSYIAPPSGTPEPDLSAPGVSSVPPFDPNAPVIVAPPADQTATLPLDVPQISIPASAGTGWDALVQYWTTDAVTLAGLDQTWEHKIASWSNGVPWQG